MLLASGEAGKFGRPAQVIVGTAGAPPANAPQARSFFRNPPVRASRSFAGGAPAVPAES